jgi:hypothetical protein
MFIIGEYCVVKCTDPKCAMESIPWKPPLEKIQAIHKVRRDKDMEDYIELDRKRKEYCGS